MAEYHLQYSDHNYSKIHRTEETAFISEISETPEYSDSVHCRTTPQKTQLNQEASTSQCNVQVHMQYNDHNYSKTAGDERCTSEATVSTSQSLEHSDGCRTPPNQTQLNEEALTSQCHVQVQEGDTSQCNVQVQKTNRKRYSEKEISDAEVKRRNTEYHKRYKRLLKTPEKESQLLKYRQRKAAQHKRARERKKNLSKHKFSPVAWHGLDTFTEASVPLHYLGRMQYTCSACGALMFKDEKSDRVVTPDRPLAKFALCCSYGRMKLPKLMEPPAILKSLLMGNSAREKDFRKNIRAYNSSLAFASMCLSHSEYKFTTRGPYCFRINGQVYHMLSQMQPAEGVVPKFSQIYIYDQTNEVNNHMQQFQTLDQDVLKELQEMIKHVNPYAHLYRKAGDIIKQNPTLDIKIILRAQSENQNVDPRRYNLPSGTDVAVLLPADRQSVVQRDIVVYKNAASHPEGRNLMYIKPVHPMYDPLMYVLMFPHGDKGWEVDFTCDGHKCTAMQYYKYRLMRHSNTFNMIHRMGRLFQQYVVDVYVKIEDGRLQYIRANQSKLRADLYQGLADALQNNTDVDGSQLGRRVVLPSTFLGSARYQHQLYQDAMAIVRRYGKPDYFITFTCNPHWKEITDELLENQTAADSQDLVARVFKRKLHSLLNDIYYGSTDVLGKMIALIYVVEWQKRGSPHAHILAIADDQHKPKTPEDYDRIVCAEIPDAHQHPELHKTITTLMMHGACGSKNANAPCMVDGKCTRGYPKAYVEHTYADIDGYPCYRRRQHGKCVVRNGIELDNRNVVPYNPYLSKKYNAHINVEICSSIQSCKYLYKYVYKGSDMASVSVQSEGNSGNDKRDEINCFVNSRFVTASEACWRIFGFDIHGRDPSIQRLAVHEENMQMVYFSEEDPGEAVANPKNTTLLAWFQLNETDVSSHQWKYHEIPEHYVWNSSQHKWIKRKRGRCIGRMYTTNPGQGERHYLRLLLHHISGATSFSDLKRSQDGVVQKTFKEAAMKLGLLESDDEWDQCLAEATISFMPKQLRSLFVTILIYGEPAKPEVLWERYRVSMGEDLLHQATSCQVLPEDKQKCVDNEVLILLQEELECMGACLEKFGLPTPDVQLRIKRVPRVIEEETYDADTQKEISKMRCSTLNIEQQEAFKMIMSAVQYGNQEQNMFFLNAPGGYGKTFLLEALLSTVRSMGKIALAVASSGIAAELLEGGRTAHSRFKIPIPVHENSVCAISLQSNDAKLMQRTSLIIWDEIMMAHIHHIECVDRTLRDILKVNKPYGGITTVFSGNPRQILPVVRHGNQSQIVQVCVHSSPLWNHIKQLRLTKNMRLSKDEQEFSKYVLSVGDGLAEVHTDVGQDIIQIPEKFLVHSVDELVNRVFPDIENGYPDKYFVARRAILTPRNDGVDKINELIMSKFPGQGKTYLSADTIGEDDLQDAYPTDYLNSITLSGMPPHEMTLKIGSPVILLRNLRVGPDGGLRNGTRLIVVSLGDKVLEVEIASGVHKGKCVLIPRITIAPSDTELPFTLKRRQFPVRPCFAMSTNKAQGQTLDFVGIHLPDHVFTHGQLYVAFSRVRNAQSVAVHVGNTEGYTKNIVFKEVL